MKRKGKRRLRSTRGRFISRSRVAAGARAGRRRAWRFSVFWSLAVPTAAFFLLRRAPVVGPFVSRLVPEEAVPEKLKAFFLTKAPPTAAEKAYAEAVLRQPPLQIELGPGSIGGTKRWLPPGSTVRIDPCPAGYARAKMDPGAEPWPPSPGPGWIQDSTVGLGSCRKA